MSENIIRLYKFRAKELVTEKWVYGSLVNTSLQPYIIDGIEHIHIIDPETIGEFIEAYDDSGKEIYEGDITYSGCYYSLVEYKVTKGRTNLGMDGSIPNREAGYFMDACNYLKVVGNKWDNPELVKKCLGH